MLRPLLLAALLLAPVLTAAAQIEVGTNGHVAVGPNAADPEAGLYVRPSRNSSLYPRAVYGEYEYDPGVGIGGFFVGGQQGVFGRATSAYSSGGLTIGVQGFARNGANNRGVHSVAMGDNASALNYGVLGAANGPGARNMGIYGEASGASNSNENWAGYFAGKVAYVGAIQNLSDGRVKQNVRSLEADGVLAKVLRVKPRKYAYRPGSARGLDGQEHYGVVAQELEQVFPELVSEFPLISPSLEVGKPDGPTVMMKGVNYLEMIPLLLQAIQEQQAQIEALKAKVQALEQR